MWIFGYVLISQLLLANSQYYLEDQTLGCDGVIGSGKNLDVCGKCGGNNDTCKIVSGIFTKRTERAAYEYITEFPVGAANINITEARNTRNYLALRYAAGSRSIINGNWSLDWSGDYEAAGTTVKYRKARARYHQAGENISITGPLQEKIKLFLLVQTRNPGIYYQYTLPVESRGRGAVSSLSVSAVAENRSNGRIGLPKYLGDSLGSSAQQHSGSSYRWKAVNTGKCTRTCGEGHMEIKVVCVLISSQVTVTEENCSDSPRPDRQQTKCNTQPCPPEWETGEWSECSATCGRSTQTRQVTCKKRISATQDVSVYAMNCESSKKPSTVKMCPEKICYTWRESQWSQCSVKCGTGRKQRQVECVNSESVKVEDELCILDKPRHVERCYSSCEESWFYGEWSTEMCEDGCRGGNSTRQVYCPADGDTNYLVSSRCGVKPQTVQTCESRRECAVAGQWFAGEWSNCDGDCSTAYQSREVVCLIKEGGTSVLTAKERCVNNRIPEVRQKCRPKNCDNSVSAWLVTDWSQCSATCGDGYSKRQIKCLDRKQNMSNDCPPATKPITVKTCSISSCPLVTTASRDPNCRDKYSSCRLAVQARLCKLHYYKTICCESCAYVKG